MQYKHCTSWFNKLIHRIDIPRRTGFVDWWEVKKFQERCMWTVHIWYKCLSYSVLGEITKIFWNCFKLCISLFATYSRPYFMYKKQRTITQKLGSGGLRFLCSTLPLIKVYLSIKVHVNIFCSHRNMFHTRFKYEK